MTRVRLQYRPFQFVPWQRGINCLFPGSWAELSSNQMVVAGRILKGTATDDTVIQSMLGVSRRVARRLSSFQKYNLLCLLSFLEGFEPCHWFVIPLIAGFRAPLPRLKEETFASFLFAEHHFEQYFKGSDLDELCRFVACWYRIGTFSESAIESGSLQLRKEDPAILEAVALNYHLIREWLAESYPSVFDYAQEEQPQNQETTWLNVLDAIVGDDIVRYDEYAALPVNTVLRFLNSRINENRRHGKR